MSTKKNWLTLFASLSIFLQCFAASSSNNNQVFTHIPNKFAKQSIVLKRLAAKKSTFKMLLPTQNKKNEALLFQLMETVHSYKNNGTKGKINQNLLQQLNNKDLQACQHDDLKDLIRLIDYLNITNEAGVAISLQAYKTNVFADPTLELFSLLHAMKLVQHYASYFSGHSPSNVLYPLHYACSINRIDLAEHLINRKHGNMPLYCMLNSPNAQAETPLSLSMKNNNTPMIKLLLKESANIDTVMENGETPLTYAIQQFNQTILHTLLQSGANPRFGNREYKAPFEVAIDSRNYQAISKLISKGINPNQILSNNSTPLFHAIDEHDFELFKSLIEHTANPTIFVDGNNALHYAVAKNFREAVTFLIENNININGRNMKDKTPLIIAAKNHRSQITQDLCHAHADVNAQDPQGKTALMYAARTNIVDTLISAHANVNIADHKGRTALDLAAEYPNSNNVIINRLIQAGAQGNENVLQQIQEAQEIMQHHYANSPQKSIFSKIAACVAVVCICIVAWWLYKKKTAKHSTSSINNKEARAINQEIANFALHKIGKRTIQFNLKSA